MSTEQEFIRLNRELHGIALPAGALIETAHALGYTVALIPRQDA